MIAFTVNADFESQMLQAIAEFEEEISSTFESWTRRAFASLVSTTPQYTGDLASNWMYAVNQPNDTYIPNGKDEIGGPYIPGFPKEAQSQRTPSKMGDPQAIKVAIDRSLLVKGPTWKDLVFITNATPIAPAVDAHSIYIRSVNLVAGQVLGIQYTIAKVEALPV